MQLSMDSVGRWADNIIIERWFRTFKHEHLYLMDYQTMKDARSGIAAFIRYYNDQRLHSSLDYLTPKMVYFNEVLRVVAWVFRLEGASWGYFLWGLAVANPQLYTTNQTLRLLSSSALSFLIGPRQSMNFIQEVSITFKQLLQFH